MASLASPVSVQVSVEKIYVKDLSLENPGAPQTFRLSEAPSIEIGLRTRADQIEPDVYECVMTVTVTATAGDRTVFLVEVAQAGIFSLRNVPAGQLDALLGIACPTILFPYLREAISDLVVRAGFPPVLLSPVSFEALYMQRLQQQAGQQQGAGPQIEIAR